MKHRLLKSVTIATLALTLVGTVEPCISASASTFTKIHSKNIENFNTINMPDNPKTPVKPKFGEPGYPIDYLNQTSHYDDTVDTHDLQGYQTANGQWKIAKNQLFRSSSINWLHPEDYAMLDYFYNVRSVVDFQIYDTNYHKNTPAIPNATYSHKPIQPIKAFDGSLFGTYFVQTPSVDRTYKEFFKNLLVQDGATLYYDNSGTDSVGITTYLLMTMLGMDQNTRIQSFMLSNSYEEANVHYTDLIDYVTGIQTRRGGMNNYFKYALGMGPEQIEALRAKYLVSTDGKQTPYTTAANKPLPKPTPAPTKPTPTPVPPTASTPAPVQPNETRPTPAPQPAKPTPTKPSHKPGKVKKTVKVISVKSFKHGRYVFVGDHKPYFKDMHLKHRLGKTKKHFNTRYKVLKQAKLKVNGKKATYLKIKAPKGKAIWINQHHIFEILR